MNNPSNELSKSQREAILFQANALQTLHFTAASELKKLLSGGAVGGVAIAIMYLYKFGSNIPWQLKYAFFFFPVILLLVYVLYILDWFRTLKLMRKYERIVQEFVSGARNTLELNETKLFPVVIGLGVVVAGLIFLAIILGMWGFWLHVTNSTLG